MLRAADVIEAVVMLLALVDAACLRHRFSLVLPLGIYARVLLAAGAMAAVLLGAQAWGWQATPQAVPLLLAQRPGQRCTCWRWRCCFRSS